MSRATASAPRPAQRLVRASMIPLTVGAVSVVLSVALLVISLVRGASTEVLPGVSFPVLTADQVALAIAGYVLTVVVIICFGIDKTQQRRSLANKDFVARPELTRMLGWLAFAGLAVGLWHILQLALVISEQIAGGAA